MLKPLAFAVLFAGCLVDDSTDVDAETELQAVDVSPAPPPCSAPIIIGSDQSVTIPAGCGYMVAKLWGEGGVAAVGSSCRAPGDLRGNGGGGGFVGLELKVNPGEVYRFHTHDFAGENTGPVASYFHREVAIPSAENGYSAAKPIALAAAGGSAGCVLATLTNFTGKVAGNGGAGGLRGQDGTEGRATSTTLDPVMVLVAGGGKGALRLFPGAGGISSHFAPGSNGYPGLAWGAWYYWIGGAGRTPTGGRGGDGIFGGGGGAAASPSGDAWGVGGGGGGGSNYVLASWNGETVLFKNLSGINQWPGNRNDPDRGNAGDGAVNGNFDGGPGRIVLSFTATRRYGPAPTLDDAP